jgi:hypothetical protein
MLFNQAVFVLDRPKSRLAREYRKLTRELIRYNPADREGALQFLRRYDDPRMNPWFEDEKMVDQGLPAGKGLFDKFLAHFFDKDPDVVFEMATCYLPEGSDAERDKKLLDQVLVLKPDHPGALIRRGTVADLFQYLRDQGLESPNGFDALRRLGATVPERLSEAVDCAIARGVDTESKFQLAKFLAETNAALPQAIQFMRDYLSDENNPDRKAAAIFLLQSYLIRSHRWREVVDMYDAKADVTAEALSWTVPFNAGMAHWAQAGTVPEGISDEILQRLGQEYNWELLGNFEPVPSTEGQSWYYCWRGDHQIALHLLGSWIELMEKWIKDKNDIRYHSWWSFWRYRGVQLSEYLEDCRQLRRMIQGEPIRPPFLGDSA